MQEPADPAAEHEQRVLSADEEARIRQRLGGLASGHHVSENGLQRWTDGGRLHRLDGRAVIRADGIEEWHQNGTLHREGGPALIDGADVQYWHRGTYGRSAGRLERALLRLRRRN